MWKLIWKDSLRDSRRYYGSLVLFILPLNMINILNMMDTTAYGYICTFFLAFIFTILLIYPLKLAKGLFLCPMTESDRKKYLITTCFLRFGRGVFLFILILLSGHLFFKTDYITALLQFCFFCIYILGLILASGTYSTSAAMQQYVAFQKKSMESIPEAMKGREKIRSSGAVFLIIPIILSAIGVIIPTNEKGFDTWMLFFYLPFFLLSLFLLILYFVKYFDNCITVTANCEVYFFLRKKKAGAH